jgi:glycosyltransferase involved in cell wall biosynthesis
VVQLLGAGQVKSVKISVAVVTYNHEQYIAQCLDSILMQEGTCNLEVIIGDDYSTDRTRQIVRDYQEKHPDIFLVLPTTANMGIARNVKRCLDACSGDYIAICDGDDYWTDPYKLAKQAAFLESHPDYSLCFNAVVIYVQKEDRYETFSDQLRLEKDTLTTEDLIENNYIGNSSACVYRTSIIRQLPEEMYNDFVGEWVLNMACGRMGKIGFMRDWMSVYRRHSGGVSSGASRIDGLRLLSAAIDSYNQLFCYDYDRQFRQKKKIIEEAIAQYDKESHDPGRLVARLRTYLCLLLRAIRHPKQALDAIRGFMTIVATQGIEVNSQLTTRNREVGLLILDSGFPHPISRFRYEEFCSYLAHFENSMVLSTGADLAVYRETKGLGTIINEFERTHPEFRFRTQVSTYRIDNYTAKLAYCTFLNIAYQFLEALEKKRIPFVFTLYPGGGFEIDQYDSNRKLRRVLGSAQFRRVIVTQPITYQYLVKNHFCTEDKIEFIYGGVMPLDVLANCNSYHKTSYGFERNDLAICFVAFKSVPGGVNKGYDVFVQVAKRLVQMHSNISLHVVGNFNEADLPIDGLEGRITFYGPQTLDWFDTFYMDKDIILSPNIPFVLQSNSGTFDGFPTGCCVEAGLRKVAVFCTDELKLNNHFADGEEIVIIPHDCDRIVGIVEAYYSAPDKLRSVGEKGAAKLQEVFSYENQMVPRISILENEMGKGLGAKGRG